MNARLRLRCGRDYWSAWPSSSFLSIPQRSYISPHFCRVEEGEMAPSRCLQVRLEELTVRASQPLLSMKCLRRGAWACIGRRTSRDPLAVLKALICNCSRSCLQAFASSSMRARRPGRDSMANERRNQWIAENPTEVPSSKAAKRPCRFCRCTRAWHRRLCRR
ncbi:hypothetical protein BDD14_6571 [Edaphobacter modestus]|uniref:Uncharacterized protein n=1 Tax=Edaphobacter modestus TaxID=388466 RepID=A0A4Q7XYG8_9BACT|nr:hypothetical protein BDD14_6571 [Edaphobacter modestus]